MHEKAWKIFQTMAYIIVLISILTFLGKYLDTIFTTLKNNFKLVVITTTLSVVAQLNQAFGYRSLLNPADRDKISVDMLVKIWGASGLINYLGPQAGIAFRSFYLKRSNIDLKTSLFASAKFAIVSTCVGSLTLLFCLPISPIYKLFLIIIGALTLGAILIFRNKLAKMVSRPKISTAISSIASPMNPASILHISAQYLILVVVYYTIFKTLADQTNIITIIITAVSIPLSTLISITPNGLGIIETIIYTSSAHQNLDSNLAACIIVITRLSHVLSATLCLFAPTAKQIISKCLH